MGVYVEDNSCCLCQNGMIESYKHMFVECEYVAKVRAKLLQWANIFIPAKELKTTLEMIKLKHWKKFKKEVVTAIWGAIVYHIWKARNWKHFKGVQIQYTDIVEGIIRELIARIDMHKNTKRAHRCRSFW
ncbi:hypothetical protein KY285_005385 [Solanum tuberosum]|nr:hypothetical protein KY285_005385 [Solanum tuberosum]